MCACVISIHSTSYTACHLFMCCISLSLIRLSKLAVSWNVWQTVLHTCIHWYPSNSAVLRKLDYISHGHTLQHVQPYGQFVSLLQHNHILPCFPFLSLSLPPTISSSLSSPSSYYLFCVTSSTSPTFPCPLLSTRESLGTRLYIYMYMCIWGAVV